MGNLGYKIYWLSRKKLCVTVWFLLCFILYLRAISKYKPLGTYINFGGAIQWSVLCIKMLGLINAGAYLQNFKALKTSCLQIHQELQLNLQHLDVYPVLSALNQDHTVFHTQLYESILGLKKIIWVIGVLSFESSLLESREGLTTVLLRTPITQMIFFNQGMLLLGSNHFLIYL